MRADMQVAGNAIDRVLNPPIAPARKFGGLIDVALTLAFGSICAFGLTLGPAPLNTVAVSSAAAASLSGQVTPEPQGATLLPAEPEADESGDTDSDAEAPAVPPEAQTETPTPPATDSPAAKVPESAVPVPLPTVEVNVPEVIRPDPPIRPAPSASIASEAALAIVETHRIAAGLGAFVTPESCAASTVHATVAVTPPGLLLPPLAKKSLAPDPAYATVSGAPGAVSVTIHACQ